MRFAARAARSRTVALLCLCVCQVSAPAYAAEHWTRITTAHFEMFTTNKEKPAVRALQTFEQVRYFFAQFSHSNHDADGLVRVIAFSSDKEYKPYRLNEGAFAYYTQSRQRDYIVMQDIEAEHSQAALHEYTHLVVRHLKLELPVWLNEGLADFYSSLEPEGDRAVVGRPLPGRVVTLFSQHWIDWPVLLNVDQNSPYYNENAKMSIFYAQSWALTHMLVTGDGYRLLFPRFLAAVAGGESSEKAFQTVYGKSLKDIDADLHAYVRARTVKALVFNVKLTKSDLEPEVTPLPDLQRDLAMSDLLATQPSKAGQAKTLLEALSTNYPQSPEVQESLGYLFWRQGNMEQTRAHFRAAYELHSRDVPMLLAYAQMQASAGAPPAEVMKSLQYAFQLDPSNPDVRLELATAAVNSKQYGYALSILAEIKTVTHENACRFFSLEAYSDLNLQQESAARTNAQKALEYAKTPAERQPILDMLSYLDRAHAPVLDRSHVLATASAPDAAKPVPEAATHPRIFVSPGWQTIKGRAKALECTAKGLRFHLQVSGREMIFAIPDPAGIIVENAPHNAVEWSCGPLSQQEVTVFYDPARSDATVTSGELKQLIF